MIYTRINSHHEVTGRWQEEKGNSCQLKQSSGKSCQRVCLIDLNKFNVTVILRRPCNVRERSRCSSRACHANLETSRAVSRNVTCIIFLNCLLSLVWEQQGRFLLNPCRHHWATLAKHALSCNDKHCIDIWNSVSTINRLRFTNNLSCYFIDTLKRLNWTCRLPGYHDLPLLCRFLTTNHAGGKRARRKLRQMTR